jgi:nitroreductase
MASYRLVLQLQKAAVLTVPPAPEFGQPIDDQASPPVLAFLSRRKSASAIALRAPGPSRQQLDDLLRLAARAPDHGKINPWRFVVLRDEAKADFTARLAALAEGRADAPKALAALGKLRNPPLAVAVISNPVECQIPLWEQQMSAGAVCTLLLTAATAMGFGANWITDWYAYDADAMAILGVRPGERVTGFLYIGTNSEPPLERVRPEMADIISDWAPPRA